MTSQAVALAWEAPLRRRLTRVIWGLVQDQYRLLKTTSEWTGSRAVPVAENEPYLILWAELHAPSWMHDPSA